MTGKKTAVKKPAKKPLPPKRNKELTHIKDLTPDPHQARKHNPRNIGMIADSLQEVGAWRSISIDEHDVVIAGNGTIEAAADVGIVKVMVVEAPGDTIVAVRRRGLTEAQKRRYAIADNRTNELSEFDVEMLKRTQDDGIDLSGLWTEKELANLLARNAAEDAAGADGGVQDVPEAFQVLVTCKSEGDHAALLERLTAEGYVCRALVS